MWLGCTPPPLAYFSWSHLVLQKQPGFHTVWADSGDSINMLVANSTMQNQHSINSTAALLVSADATSAGGARAAIIAAGLASSAINTLQVPSALVGRMGTTASDDLMQVCRCQRVTAGVLRPNNATLRLTPCRLFSERHCLTTQRRPRPIREACGLWRSTLHHQARRLPRSQRPPCVHARAPSQRLSTQPRLRCSGAM